MLALNGCAQLHALRHRRERGAATAPAASGIPLHPRHHRAPRVLITDKLASYGAAKREVMPSVEHRKHKGLNNRADNSHQPTRRRERQIKRFKSAGQAQRLLSAHDGINNLFHLRRHQVPATQYRAARTQAFQIWTELRGHFGIRVERSRMGVGWPGQM